MRDDRHIAGERLGQVLDRLVRKLEHMHQHAIEGLLLQVRDDLTGLGRCHVTSRVRQEPIVDVELAVGIDAPLDTVCDPVDEEARIPVMSPHYHGDLQPGPPEGGRVVVELVSLFSRDGEDPLPHLGRAVLLSGKCAMDRGDRHPGLVRYAL